MRLILNPYTGRNIDYDTIPEFDNNAQKPGRYCSSSGRPLDEVALTHFHYAYGNDDTNNRLRKLNEEAVKDVNAALAKLDSSITSDNAIVSVE